MEKLVEEKGSVDGTAEERVMKWKTLFREAAVRIRNISLHRQSQTAAERLCGIASLLWYGYIES